MTQFNKADFSYHGGYLMYTGDYAGRPVYEDKPGTHPSRVGTGRDLFIARFKYSSSAITKAQFQKELINSFTVEQYVEACNNGSAPLEVLRDNNLNWYNNLMDKFMSKRTTSNSWWKNTDNKVTQ